METVKIRTKEGRRAFTDAACKREIPHDRFIPVVVDAHIRRLIDIHGDVEVAAEAEAEPEAAQGDAEAAPLTGIAAIQAAAHK